MNSKKCPTCGVVAFADAAACKKCGHDLTGVEARQTTPAVEEPRPTRYGIAAAGLFLCTVVAVGLFFLFSSPSRHPSPSAGVAQGGAAPVETPVHRAVSGKNAVAARRALDELYKLQSVTEAGLNFMQYGDRVLSAKVETDAALRSLQFAGPTDTEFAGEVREAMAAYVDAKDAWGYTIQTESGLFYVKDNSYLTSKYGLDQNTHTRTSFDGEYKSEYLFQSEVLNKVWAEAGKHVSRAAALLPS